MADKKYKFNRPKDRVITTTSAVIGLSALGLGLSFVFNPVALGVAAGIAAINQGANMLLSVPAYRKWMINQQVKKGRWGVVPDDAPAARITAEISSQLGRPQPPKIYTVDSKFVAKMALPFGLRWLFKAKSIQDASMPGIFAALPGANTMITTKEALNNGLTEDQLRFIAAHEMSHLQAKDNRSPSLVGKNIIKKMTRVLFWGSLAAIGASLAGVALPVLLGGGVLSGLCGIGALVGINIAAKAINNFGMRTVEQRADRNALYITRDLDSAKGALAHIDPTAAKKTSILKEMSLDHPSYNRRVKIMRKAFEKVSRLPALPAPDTIAAVVQPQKKNALGS